MGTKVNFDQNFLKTLTVLYAEDDEHARNSLSGILHKLFKKVYVGEDGRQGLEYFKKFHEDIDVIVSDINMPHLSGMDMLERIREIDERVPFIFTTAHQEKEFLLGAIKYGVYHYAKKPVNIKEIIYKVQEACQVQYQESIAMHNHKEAQAYLNVINQTALVSKTDLMGDIIYVNDMFCGISGYSEDELIDAAHNIVKHPDSPAETFYELWETIRNGDRWSGKLKNQAKDGEAYFVTANIFPMYDEFDSEIIGYMAIEFLTTDEENEKRGYKTHIRQMVVEQKRVEMTLKNEIKTLKRKLGDSEHMDIIQEGSAKANSQNKKLLKQMSFYEDKIRNFEAEKIHIQKTAKEHYFNIMEQNKSLIHHKKVNDRKVTNFEILTDKQSREIEDLYSQVNSQSKIVIDLKDVIEHRESQLAKYQKANN